MRVQVNPSIDKDNLHVGQEVLLNEAMNVTTSLQFEKVGEVVMLKEILSDGERALVLGRADEERIVTLAEPLRGTQLRSGDSLLLEPRSGFVYERIPKSEVEELVLEEVPDIEYEDIGGLKTQIEMIRDAVELPFLHADLYAEHRLLAPKGILLYGPPGCGKTLIAKAVAKSLAKKVSEKTGVSETRSFFLNIKGPELLNKFVGETERHIRLIFQRAREKSAEGFPVIVFFDEMDSLFRTRGSGVSSDVENTIVPQLLSEIDGVETLDNVIVIGASNREDMIDPAILRPGRLDVKIKIERPDAQAAADILSKYLISELPLHEDDLNEHGGSREATVQAMIQRTVEQMYSESDDNRFLEVTYANGDKEVLYFKDFNSGAMLENVVSRAKKLAIKEFLETGKKGIRMNHLLMACIDEFRENEDLPNTTNPDDWARISGKKGERIVFIRTLIQGKSGTEAGRSIDTLSNTGQYL
jgi:proteasome-associated ATPase